MQGYQVPKCKKIVLQELEERPQIETVQMDQKKLVNIINWRYRWGSNKVLCYKDSGIGQQRVEENTNFLRVSSFFQAFLKAYTQHGDVLLVPDQIWIMITFYISKYIDENAEKLRSKLVHHDKVKTLTVVETAQSVEDSLLLEKNWDYFFDQIIKMIDKQTVKGVVDEFACDFSTTNSTYKIISTAVIMNSMKKFFNYHRRFCICGINNIYMSGVREDWARMIDKLESMGKYDVDGKLKLYIQHMKIILQNFLLTFDEKPDVAWWNTIMKTGESKQIYGGEKTEISGWILNFFGMYEKSQISGFPEMTLKVPIKLINDNSKSEKSLLLVSDWVSISKMNERTYKPDVAVCIFELEQKSLNQFQKQNSNY